MGKSMKVVGYAGSRSAFSKSICLGEKLKTMLREKNIEMELYTARNNVVDIFSFLCNDYAIRTIIIKSEVI